MSRSEGYRMSLDPPTAIDYDRVKRTAFHEQKILVVHVDDDRIAWPEREILKAVGEKLYGKLRSNAAS